MEPDDRLMTVKELAAYLNLNERTVLKLAAEGPMPAVKVGNQWRFRKAMIDAWLDDQMLGISRRYIEPPRLERASRLLLDLASCFGPSHVIPDLGARTKTTVVEELAAHAHSLGLVRDRTWFVGGLIERENVMPSATGNGIAFLHTLHRHPDQVVRPFMVLGRSRQGVDFAARETYRNISMRVIRAYDINNDVFPTRIDILYGTTTYYDELAVRLAG